MDAADRLTVGFCVFLTLVYLVLSAPTGFWLAPQILHVVGASPATTLEQPWALLTGPLIHHGLGQLAYILILLLLVLPRALRAYGPLRTLAAAYVLAAAVVFAINLLVIAPLARAGVDYAEAAFTRYTSGASGMAFVAAGMVVSAWGWRGWRVAAAVAAVALYETLLSLLHLTGPFIEVYHTIAFAAGITFPRLAGWRPGAATRSAPPRARPPG